MTSHVRHRRSTTAGAVPPNTMEPGELAVNMTDRRLFTSASGAPIDLLAIRIYSPNAAYQTGDLVANGPKIYTALANVVPGPWTPAQWQEVGGQAVYEGPTAPTDTVRYALWYNTAATPPNLYFYKTTAPAGWVNVNDNSAQDAAIAATNANVATNTTDITALTTRVTATETVNTRQDGDLTSLDARVDTIEAGLLSTQKLTVEGPATNGQNTITIPGGYAKGMCDVFVGGAALSRPDYDDSDGLTVKLARPMAVGTQYKVLAWSLGQTVQPVAGQLASWRNKIINGNFDIWQRGVSGPPVDNNGGTPTGPNVYGYKADHWFGQLYGGAGSTGNAVMGMDQQAFALGQTEVPGNPRFFLRLQAKTLPTLGTSGGQIRVQQAIEGVRTLAGGQAFLTFWARAESARTAAAVLSQNFGTGGSPSASVTAGQALLNLTTTFQKFRIPVTVPSIAGKTLGTNLNDYFLLTLYSYKQDNTLSGDTLGPVGVWSTAAYMDIARVQLEPGPVDTDFEDRPLATELALCQRYFCASQGSEFGVWINATDAFINFVLPVPMRSIPTVALTTPSLAIDITAQTPKTCTNGAIAGSGMSSRSGYAQLTGTWTLTAAAYGQSARLATVNALFFTAEL